MLLDQVLLSLERKVGVTYGLWPVRAKVGVVQKALPQPPTLTGGSIHPQPYTM